MSQAVQGVAGAEVILLDIGMFPTAVLWWQTKGYKDGRSFDKQIPKSSKPLSCDNSHVILRVVG
jgi:hypothetical protein